MLPNQINTLDPNALADLKRLARNDSPQAIRAAAQQFEALFLQMVLKSMRDATPTDGMFDNDQSRMYQGLLDQQLAMNMAQSRGVGLADALVRQLGGNVQPTPAGNGDDAAGGEPAALADAENPAARQSLPELAAGLAARRAAARAAEAAARAANPAVDAAAATYTAAVRNPVGTAATAPSQIQAAAARRGGALREQQAAATAGAAARANAKAPSTAAEFVDRVWPHALQASRETGIPARFLVAHAALETGWGRNELRHADGRPSHNLFNIKAGKSWQGATVSTSTTEYAGGRAYTERASFRSYGSYAEAFRDYARLLASNPRYAEVRGQTDAAGFARGLQQAGYATDPMYAEKLTRIIGGRTLRVALADSSTTSA